MPVPDEIKDNPHYRRGSPMQLFLLERIAGIEDSAEFKGTLESVAKRKKSAEKAVETKRMQVRQYLDSVRITVPLLAQKDLIRKACSHYNDMQIDREFNGYSTCGESATKGSDPKFLMRICVNFLRHCLTEYEEHLDAISGKVGFDDGYFEIREKIFTEIAAKYPWLAKECRRQESGC